MPKLKVGDKITANSLKKLEAFDKASKDREILEWAVKKFRITKYEDALYFLVPIDEKNAEWKEVDEIGFKSLNIYRSIASLIEIEYAKHTEKPVYLTDASIKILFSWFVSDSKIKRKKSEDVFKGIVFTNGFVNKHGFHEVNEETRHFLPFSTSQIPMQYDPNQKIDKTLERYLKGLSGHKEDRYSDILKMLAAGLSNESFAYFGIISSKTHDIGKTLLIHLMNSFIGHNRGSMISSKEFLEDERFGLRNIKNKTFIGIDELKGHIDTKGKEAIKKISNLGKVNYQKKNENDSITDATMSLLATTNYKTSFVLTDSAFISRLVFFEVYDSKLTKNELAYIGNYPIKMMTSLLPLLVKKYVEIKESKLTRAKIFKTNEIQNMIKYSMKVNFVIKWIKNNAAALNNQPIEFIYRTYIQDMRSNNVELEKITPSELMNHFELLKWKKIETPNSVILTMN